jgi:hypothetical protein
MLTKSKKQILVLSWLMLIIAIAFGASGNILAMMLIGVPSLILRAALGNANLNFYTEIQKSKILKYFTVAYFFATAILLMLFNDLFYKNVLGEVNAMIMTVIVCLPLLIVYIKHEIKAYSLLDSQI